MPPWLDVRAYPVLKAVQVFGTVRHRETLNEILYFANLKKSVFQYHWGTRSVFSDEVGYTIDDFVYGPLDVKDRDEDAERDLSLSDSGRRLLGLARHDEVDSAVDWARGLLDGMSPRRVKVLASVHFLAFCGQEPAELHARIRRMSFENDFAVQEVAWAMQFLESKGLLEPAPAAGAEPARTPA